MGHYPLHLIALHLIKEVAENLQTTDTIEVFRRVVRMVGCAANVKGQLGITNRCRKAPESIPCLICANCSKYYCLQESSQGRRHPSPRHRDRLHGYRRGAASHRLCRSNRCRSGGEDNPQGGGKVMR